MIVVAVPLPYATFRKCQFNAEVTVEDPLRTHTLALEQLSGSLTGPTGSITEYD